MRDPLLFYVIVGGLALVVIAAYAWRQYRWLREKRAPFPENRLRLVRATLPYFDRMPTDLQQQLLAQVTQFLHFKRFVGCAGLVVTEEMRVTIAASACLLLLNRPTLQFRNVRWIYLYPAEFVVRHTVSDAAGVETTEEGILSGESWNDGRIILSWDDVRQGVYDFNDGRNVVLHEFAHQLDAESGGMNGAPLLHSKGAYGSWATILSREFDSLRDHAYFGHDTVLDAYGATSPAEFFAVATESFFEDTEALAVEHPQLFAELLAYYQVDPRQWRVPSVVH
jgi:Mlc titration factor MtfA (ptsG expression regulator)